MLIVLVALLSTARAFHSPYEEGQGLAKPELVQNEVGLSPQLDNLADYLGFLLEGEETEIPLIFVKEDEPPGPTVFKRSRYYRRYPWKRQNGKNYDPEGYLCAPSREDVFQLLLAIHDARSGNSDRTVHFCNRRRPARAIFTNIRFLGRR